MNLKKMIGICLSFVLVLAGALWIDRTNENIVSDPPVTEEKLTDTEEMAESMSYLSNPKYYLFEFDGRVAVFEKDKETMYLETAIPVEMLPESLRSDLKDGIAIDTERELYEFLENYSS